MRGEWTDGWQQDWKDVRKQAKDAEEPWGVRRLFQIGRNSCPVGEPCPSKAEPMVGSGEEKEVDPRRLEFRAARKEWWQDNKDSRPLLRDLLSEEDHAAMLAFKNAYEGEGHWSKSDLLSDSFKDTRSQWLGDMKDWRAERPTWESWSSE